jgi:TP901 family phage tail tape measure protein
VVVSNIQLRVNSTQAVKALNSANVAAKKLNATLQKSQGAMKSTQGTMRGMASAGFGAAKGMGAAAVSVRGLGTAFKAALGPLGLAISAIGAVTAGVRGFVEADKARAAVRTLGVDAEALEGQLVGVVANTKGLASSNQLLAASYDVASAGFSKAADISKILEASTFGAVGGMTDIATVSDAATSVMNAFGLTTDSVAKIVDGFIQTQNDGKIVVGQYASQIGRVAPIAAAAGVGVDELNAAISTVTAQGVPVESTFSGINQVIASVVKPTAEAAKAAKRLGLDFSSAAIKTKGFGGFLEDLIAKTGGSEVEITKLFGSVDALKALMPLINDDLVRFNKNLENQKNATGAAEDAADIMGETVSSQISRILNSLSTLVRGLDQVLGPAIKGILSLVNNVITAAVRATDALTKMFRMRAARQQAREEMGGRIGRGTFKPSQEAIDARALEIYNEQMAASPATVAPTVTPTNTITPTGNLTGGTTSTKKTPLQKQTEDYNKLLQQLERRRDLEKEVTSEARELKELEFAKADIAARFPLLKQEEVEKLQNLLQETYNLKKADEERIEAAKRLKEEQDKQLAKVKEIADVIQNGITGAIMGAIDGSKSLSSSLSGILKQLGGMFLSQGIGSFNVGGKGGSGLLGLFNFGGKRAAGGTVQGGRSYMVGERGPELFTPGRTGSIAPNSAVSGDMNVVVNVDASGTEVQGNQGNADQLGRLIGQAVQAELIKQKRPGGLLTR